MDNNIQTKPEPGLAPLLSGIVTDIQTLVKQQLALFRQEIQEDLHKAKEGSILLGVGAGFALLALVLLSLGLVHLMSWAAPNVPLWCCYGLVGVVEGAAALILIFQARAQLATLNHPLDKTAQAIEENLEWKTAPK